MVSEVIRFLIQHGYFLVFGVVLLEQLGFPIPSTPVLLAAGALAAAGDLSYAGIFLWALAGALIGDMVWYELGRHRGRKVLTLICRFSLEPDSCVRRTEDIFVRHSGRTLLAAKFLPGLSTVAPPLAGLLGMSKWKFVAYDAAGSFLWVGLFTGIGLVFNQQIEYVARLLARLGNGALALLLSGLAAYLLSKFFYRRRFIRQLRTLRISPEELIAKLSGGEDIIIVDLRTDLAMKSDPVKLPGAIHILPEEIEKRHQEIPRDRDVVLYCSCPNEASSAKAAMRLARRGITRVRPLEGGFEEWRNRGLPVENAAKIST
jgi:membrane protein DedA with SNARE-associated domain/rhodanese-related sulfurtransferase